MYSLTKDRPKVDRPNFEMPDIDLSKIELPNLSKVELPKMDLSRFEMPKLDFEMPKIDVGKAVNDAAISAGLVRSGRPRWQYAVGAGIVAAVAGWAFMNQAMIRERLNQAKTWVGDQVGAMRAERPEDAIAFRTVPTAPLESGLPFDGDAAQTDYPEGFGAPTEMAVGSDDEIPAFEEARARV